jgi:tetratricopeptide (TPR) repeat protein
MVAFLASNKETDSLTEAMQEYHGLKHAGDFSGAMHVAKKALDIATTRHGREHVNTANVCHDIGGILRSMGDCQNAQRWYEEGLRVRVAQLGRRHPLTASSLNSLGMLFAEVEDYENAIAAMQAALDIMMQCKGPDDRDTLTDAVNLASVYLSAGKVAEGAELAIGAMQRTERRCGGVSTEAAMAYEVVANAYTKQGKYDDALAYQEKALAIFERHDGPDSYHGAIALNNIGYSQSMRGDTLAALVSYQLAKGIFTRTLGMEHPQTQRVVDMINSLLRDAKHAPSMSDA